MLVSVIVTNYNYAHYLKEAIDSVLNQTYQHFELIIVDDGSTDNSKEIIKSYQVKYPEKVLPIFKRNDGQGSAFNAGVAAAKGEIVAFLDADDYWYKNKLEVIVPLHKQYKGVQHNLLINGKQKYVFLSNEADTRKAFLEGGFTGAIPTSGLSYNKDVLIDKVFPVPETDYRICSDNYVRSQFLVHYNVLSVDEPLGFYRAHSSNLFFNNKNQHLNTVLQAVNEAIEKYNEINKDNLPLQNNHVEVYSKRMFDSLGIPKDLPERYVIYGTGEAGGYYFDQLNKTKSVVAFASTYPWVGEFMQLPVWTVEALKENIEGYDKILIASQQMAEIYEHLLYEGFEEERVIHPKM